jgi:cytochrome c-type biogenesis protein CcsB
MRAREILLGTALTVLLAACSGGKDEPVATGFMAEVDLTAWGEIAVHQDGRLKSFDSYARTLMNYVTGARSYNDQTPTFTLMDLAFRPSAYADADILYVKKKPMRVQIAKALEDSHAAHVDGFDARMETFIEVGLISDSLLRMPPVMHLLERLRGDLVRTAKFVEMLDSASAVSDPRFLTDSMRVVPPLGADDQTPWLNLQEVASGAHEHAPGVDHGHNPALADFTDEQKQQIGDAYLALMAAWRDQKAAAVNESLGTLATLLPTIEPTLYPTTGRLSWESWYFRAKSMTWVWLLYLPAVVMLLLSLVYRWKPARVGGMAVFFIAFGFHTFAVGLRWYVSGRWPNSNMFEAVTTAAWFGCVVAIALELWARRSAMRDVFALGAAASAMAALMAVHFLPATLSSNISNMMPVLHDVWLYIHTNVIIASYCLIFMAAISALLYLGYRAFGGQAGYVRMGGAGSLMMGGGPSDSDIAGAGGSSAAKTSAGQVFDGVTMVLMELSFVMLWAGLVMGAIWADHSWGRPWGWDPKEVFALNTFLIFIVLVHVRLKSKDKGLWTAVLAVIGAGVMLFNWIVVNFVITGLHSYA